PRCSPTGAPTRPPRPCSAATASPRTPSAGPRLVPMDRQMEFVRRSVEERDVRFIRLWFTDVLGYLKSVAITPSELEGAFTEGLGFDGSAIDGFARVYEADMLAVPDPSTFQVLPWQDVDGSLPSARMFCDIRLPGGSPSWSDPRHVLRRQLDRAAEDRKSTRLNSSHVSISYAVFCF